MQFILQNVEVLTLNSPSLECECLDFRYEERKIWVKILLLSKLWMAMWLPLTHPVQFCILSIIINLGVDNRPNEKWNTQSATFTIGPIRTCNTNFRELNAPVEMLIQINTLKLFNIKMWQKLIRSLHYLLLFLLRPWVSCFYQHWWHIRR